MLNRVVVIGSAATVQKCAQAFSADELLVTPAESGGMLPAATLAVIGDAAQPELLLPAIATLGDRQFAMLRLFALAMDAREGNLPGTAQRVHEHASRFAQALNLEPEDRLTLETAGFLQDIGKLRISNEILLKKALLTYDEWMQLQSHPKLGADLLLELGLFTNCAEIIRYHHECYDGTGYPERIERDAIPYLSRALRIVDVYCAMTSPRTYRKGTHSNEQAIEHLQNERGKHFDPELVDIFISAGVGRAT